ncbi:MAG: adenylate/guanylate cyclase domain-containing protein, partial [Candidatus Riflebacteria bacterium]
RAANAAREMVTALPEFNRKRCEKQLFAVSNGVGIASGQLLMGSMGNLEGRRDYTVTGKTVNHAAEMEKLSKKTTGLPIVLCEKSADVVAEHGFKCCVLIEATERKAYELL